MVYQYHAYIISYVIMNEFTYTVHIGPTCFYDILCFCIFFYTKLVLALCGFLTQSQMVMPQISKNL
jgi:hypothetical protein